MKVFGYFCLGCNWQLVNGKLVGEVGGWVVWQFMRFGNRRTHAIGKCLIYAGEIDDEMLAVSANVMNDRYCNDIINIFRRFQLSFEYSGQRCLRCLIRSFITFVCKLHRDWSFKRKEYPFTFTTQHNVFNYPPLYPYLKILLKTNAFIFSPKDLFFSILSNSQSNRRVEPLGIEPTSL